MLLAKKINKTFGTGNTKVQALSEVSLKIKQGDFIVILGASGSGKSTLLNVLSSLETADNGHLSYNGESIIDLNESCGIEFRRKYVGFIFQHYHLLSDLTVLENIQVGAYLGKEKVDLDELMEQLGITELKNKRPYEISGGQQQRVAIARALAKKPDLLFCDEPTGALDEKTGKLILEYLRKMNVENHTTIIMVTHTQGISAMAKRIIRMNSGEITEDIINDSPVIANEVYWG